MQTWKKVIIGLCNGMAPIRPQATAFTNDEKNH